MSDQFKTGFAANEDKVLLELGAEQMKQDF